MDRPVTLAILIGVIAIAVRLIAINQPFVDQWSWRQSDVAAIARNYFTNGFHFAYPQIDWAGDQPGYVGTEFPILPFLAASCYKFLGVHEWIGRIQALILFAASLPFFFLLVREIFGATAATWALLFYSFVPLSVMASRCFMPDMPSLSLSIIGLYLLLRWIDRGGLKLFAASASLISLSILIKATSIIIAAPLLYAAVATVYDRRKIDFQKSDGHPPSWNYGATSRQLLQRLALFAAIALLPSGLWYWHAHLIAERFYPHHFFGAGGIQIMNMRWYWDVVRRIATSSLTPLLCVLAIIGVIIARSRIKARVFYAWLGVMILFIIVAGYGNRHPWYQLPLAPIAAAFAGSACAFIGRKLSPSLQITLSILTVAAFAALAFVYTSPFYRTPAAQLRDAGLELKRTTRPGSLIVAADYGDPTMFYYAERRGWHFLEKDAIYNGHPTTSADAINDLESLRERGATHLVFYSGTFWWLDYYKEFADRLGETATLMEATPQFKIYKLNPR
jgi:4-amino-4-deoxy-L-arabinose transferase-like glycosyltransferase